MLNLSDKELDRLSKEAAQEFDPGDVLGQGSWEKLEIRMDKDLGRLPANPLRHIRRFPFYYAPALLVLIGASWFFVRQGTKGSGGPPGSEKQTGIAVIKNISSSKTPEISNKLNSTPAASSAASASPAATGKSGSAVTPFNARSGNPVSSSIINPGNPGSPSATNPGNPGSPSATNPGNPGSSSTADRRNPGHGNSDDLAGSAEPKTANSGSTMSRPGNQTGHQPHSRTQNSGSITGSPTPGADPGSSISGLTSGNNISSSTSGITPGNSTGSPTPGPAANNTRNPNRELTRSTLGPLSRTKSEPYIDDSALRHFTVKSGLPQITYKALHINRALEFGILLAPDFASVNALAGDKAGSTIGATVDYQFANRWYIGTGLLLDRKNYAARAQDFATPPANIPISQNVIHYMQYVKGSFEMLEIPLNLRYDFSVAGSTLFFASGGVSSYLFTSEHNGIYYSNYGRLSCDPQKSPTTNSYLFSSLHFSMGVETGLSNSLSLMIAPYAELPMKGIGMGQVQMSSVGIDFSLKFAPVTSRKRY